MSTTYYPVHVEAHLDDHLSRGLWLVKWALAIPHYLVLLLLWPAFLVLSVVALVAILFTGRYPRSIFEFNVGVMRWSWRVAYYAYGALGTDQYPPFSLEERPDYPAYLQVDYPEHLSRGLVLVKWWLLALPHYIVVALFAGGLSVAWTDADGYADGPRLTSAGLIGILVLVAAVVLLFSGRYPKPLFDFILGMNRWVLRVAAYAALMTDTYPPFRLDQGEGEPPGSMRTAPAPVGGPATVTAAPPTARATTPAAPATYSWSAGRVVGVLLAGLLALASLGLTGAGTALLFADTVMRDADGLVMSDTERVASSTAAVTSSSLEVHTEDVPGWLLPERFLGDVRVTAEPVTGTELFLGLAASSDVDAFLGDVRHETLQSADRSVVTGTGEAVSPPASTDIWVASASGTGEQALTWDLDEGDWTLVMMNADGTPGVEAQVAAGAEAPALEWLVPTLLTAGLAGLVLAALALVLLVRGARPAETPGRPTPL